MKVVIFELAPLWSPSFEIGLDIIERHEASGDEVHIVGCDSALVSCVAAPRRNFIDCRACISRRERGLSAVSSQAVAIRSRDDHVKSVQIPSGIADVRSLEFDGLPLGVGVASSLVSILRDSDPDLSSHKKLVERLIHSSRQVAAATRQVLREHEPDVVYVFNGRFASTWAVLAVCLQSGVECRTYDTWYRPDRYRVVANATIHDLETAKSEIEDVWSRSTEPAATKRSIGAEFYESRRSRSDTSSDAFLFTSSQTRHHIPASLAGTPYVAVFNSSEDEFSSTDGYENPLYEDQFDALEQIVMDERLASKKIVIRVHPNLSGLRNRQLRHLNGLGSQTAPNVLVLAPDDPTDSYALIDGADSVVTFGSTMGIEACYWGKPSLIVGRSPFEELGPKQARSHDEVVGWILNPTSSAGHQGPLKFGYFAERCGYPLVAPDPDGASQAEARITRVRPALAWWILRKIRNAGVAAANTISRDSIRQSSHMHMRNR